MIVTENSLREQYESQSSERLLELRARGSLTETASRILEEVLDARGVSMQSREQASALIKEKESKQDYASQLIASRGARFVAQLIDGIAIVVFNIVFDGAASAVAPRDEPLPPLIIVSALLLSLLYWLLSDALPRGQSLGKKAVGIATVDAKTKRPCTAGQSLVRNILGILGIFDWLFIFGPRRQRLGDIAAGTIVVNIDLLSRAKETSTPRPDPRPQTNFATTVDPVPAGIRNPYAPPRARLEEAASALSHQEDTSSLQYAGFWRRFLAYLIDGLVLLPLSALMYFLSEKSRMFYLYWFVPGLIIGLFFHVYLVARYGGTPGKLLLKTRVALVDGSAATMRAAVLRYGVLFILSLLSSIGLMIAVLSMTDELYYSLGYIERSQTIVQMAPRWCNVVTIVAQVWVLAEFVTMLFNKKRRAVHDYIAGTVIVRS